jgi:hypothetical protein
MTKGETRIRVQKLVNFLRSQAKRIQTESEQEFFKNHNESLRKEGQALGIRWAAENLNALLEDL